MDSEAYASAEFSSSSTTGNRGTTSCGGAIFSGSQHFTVGGGTFSSVTNNYTSPRVVPSDFRMIPLGDIDLQHEIRLNNRTGRVRRVYAARVKGRQSNMTVAMYQGHRMAAGYC
ncbi:hypothetical protein C8J57DRAFT_1483764 [Mycena rebaudengoi]|nr:hypothetical protein C8J57DRAFT_1483764 [Mycena rebaudengoi]